MCRAVNVVYDDGAISGTKGEYDKLLEKIKDITDAWVGKMRSGAPLPPPCAEVCLCNTQHVCPQCARSVPFGWWDSAGIGCLPQLVC